MKKQSIELLYYERNLFLDEYQNSTMTASSSQGDERNKQVTGPGSLSRLL